MKFVVLALALGLVLAGCLEPSVQPTATPTATPTVTVSATPSPTVQLENELEVTLLEDGTTEESFLTVLGANSFSITTFVTAPTPCHNTKAAWTADNGVLNVRFTHSGSGEICVQVLDGRAAEVKVDLPGTPVPAIKSVNVYDGGELVKTFEFEGMFCGGIAAFQCPSSFECVLDGGYPDAGGECHAAQDESEAIQVSAGSEFKITLASNPTTGFDWNVKITDNATVEYLGSSCKDCNAGDPVGSGHNFDYRFKALKKGLVKVTMDYQQSWNASSTTKTAEFIVQVN